jgi:hypothetical protein
MLDRKRFPLATLGSDKKKPGNEREKRRRRSVRERSPKLSVTSISMAPTTAGTAARAREMKVRRIINKLFVFFSFSFQPGTFTPTTSRTLSKKHFKFYNTYSPVIYQLPLVIPRTIVPVIQQKKTYISVNSVMEKQTKKKISPDPNWDVSGASGSSSGPANDQIRFSDEVKEKINSMNKSWNLEKYEDLAAELASPSGGVGAQGGPPPPPREILNPGVVPPVGGQHSLVRLLQPGSLAVLSDLST